MGGGWIDTDSDYPDWRDCGKRVEVAYEDGTAKSGVLEADDWYDTPLFTIRMDDGSVASFVDSVKWRLAGGRS